MKKLLLFLFGVLAFAGMRAQEGDPTKPSYWTEEKLAQFDADLIANYQDVVYMKSSTFPKGSGEVELPICIKSHDVFSTTEFNILLPEDLEPEYTERDLGENRIEKVGVVVGTDRAPISSLDFSFVESKGWNMIAFSIQGFPMVENNEFCSIKVNISSLAAGVYDLIVLENQVIAGFDDNPNGHVQHSEQIVTKLVVTDEVVLDELSTEYPGEYTDVNVRVLRTISAGNWNTLCLPFDMSEKQCKAAFGDDVELAEFAGYDYDSDIDLINVKFNDINSITAYRPCIIKISNATDHETGFTVENVTINANTPTVITVGRGRMFGTIVNGTKLAIWDDWDEVYTKQYLYLSGNKFYYATTKTDPMMGFRGYFDFRDALKNKGANISDVKFTFNVNNEPTSIDGISSVEKVAEGVYNLSGQKLSEESLKTLPKGVYIVNGKKVYKK